MPAFDMTGTGVVKLATVFPGNPKNGLPAVQALVVVFSEAGTPVAAIDGVTLTYLRTAAVSALASRYLSRQSSTHLAIIGTGGLAPTVAAAHCSVRPITRITVCGRRAERAEATARAIREMVDREMDITSGTDVETAIACADIVSCATSSATPVFRGKSLKAGAHVDLIGSFSVGKREADDDAVKGARIFVDNLEGALAEAGDIVDPLRRGVIGRKHIEGELADLVRGRVSGRSKDDEKTLFKSVGSAVQDLAAAILIMSEVPSM
jgi:ornithine cyclodeaminase